MTCGDHQNCPVCREKPYEPTEIPSSPEERHNCLWVSGVDRCGDRLQYEMSHLHIQARDNEGKEYLVYLGFTPEMMHALRESLPTELHLIHPPASGPENGS